MKPQKAKIKDLSSRFLFNVTVADEEAGEKLQNCRDGG